MKRHAGHASLDCCIFNESMSAELVIHDSPGSAADGLRTGSLRCTAGLSGSLGMSVCGCLQPYGPYQPGPFPPALHPGNPLGAPRWPELRPPMYGPMPFLQGPPPWSPQAAWQAYGSPQCTPSGMLRPPTPDPYQYQAAPAQQRLNSPYSSQSSLAPPSPNQHVSHSAQAP